MGLFKKKNEDIIVKALKETKTTKQEKYEKGLKNSRESFTKKFLKLATRHRVIDEKYFQDLEEVLIMADVEVQFSLNLLKKLKEEVKLKNLKDPSKMNELIFEYLFKQYTDGKGSVNKLSIVQNELNIILITGVNGVGKTTSIGKITNKLVNDGYKVSLAAADTFRAGAVAQLKVWAERTNVDITVPLKEGQDPASVVFNSIAKAKENNIDILIIDTAGRLQNKENLMNELSKINKIIERENGKPAIEILLVLDATTGQNGVLQALAFNEILKLTGIILTKMDSSSKGGIILSIKESFNIPVKFIGLGEGIEDLEEFNIKEYLQGLTKEIA